MKRGTMNKNKGCFFMLCLGMTFSSMQAMYSNGGKNIEASYIKNHEVALTVGTNSNTINAYFKEALNKSNTEAPINPKDVLSEEFNTNAFITTWTVTGDLSITIPTAGSGYSYDVDWGDGNTSSNQTSSATHTYAAGDTYTVTITGTFPRIYFNNTGDKDKIQTIEQWGTTQWTNMRDAFRGCGNLVLNATDTPNLSSVSDISAMFDFATNFVDNGGAIGTWDVSNITNMSSIFAENISFNGNISSWNVSGVTNMSYMFFNARSFNQDISGWDVSSVSDMSFMLSDAIVFNQNLESWDISNVTDMENMLTTTSSLSSENFDYLLTGWATLDAGETQIPTNITFGAPSITYCDGEAAYNLLDTTYSWTITDDAGLSCPFITVWETTSANETITIPTNGSGYSYDIDWGDGNSNTNEISSASHQYTTAGVYTISITGTFPRIHFDNQSGSDKIQSIERWGEIQWDSMQRAFYGCTNLVLNATDAPNLASVTNMSRMFEGTTSLIDNEDQIGNWNVSNVTEMRRMFTNASSFDEDLSNWNVSGVTNMISMFESASSFSPENYDALLTGWSALGLTASVNFGAPPATYCHGEAGKSTMQNTYSWNFSTDGGLSCLNLSVKAFLQGCYNESTSLMNDDLRVEGVIPTVSPYGDGDTINTSVFNTTGNDAIVDWVFVQLRDKNSISNVLHETSALLQRDGDIVDLDGSSTLVLSGSADNYFVSVSHRNHVSIASAVTISLNSTLAILDLTSVTNVFGTSNAVEELDTGIYGLFAGDTEDNDAIETTDIPLITQAIGILGYNLNDVNMNGAVQTTDTPIAMSLIGKIKQF